MLREANSRGFVGVHLPVAGDKFCACHSYSIINKLSRAALPLQRAGEGRRHLLVDLAVLLDHEVRDRDVQVHRANSRAVADAFVSMFVEVHWRAYVDAGMPAEQLPELRSVIEALQPLAAQAVVAAFQQEMTTAVGRAFDRETASLDTGLN